MNRIVLSAGLAAAAILAGDYFYELRSRLSDLEHAPQANPDELRELERRIAGLQRAVAGDVPGFLTRPLARSRPSVTPAGE